MTMEITVIAKSITTGLKNIFIEIAMVQDQMIRITQIVIKTADAVVDLSLGHRHQRVAFSMTYHWISTR